ncbi:hypothetical protein [Rodentibacter heidelbergensis]|uniref:Lipoprotein n=1 Tax=Rodentibacter heidelbergensis TaxID=1908258 RepID=A0A1V3I6R3_9PAST|nr:hypothetical protein [Rodentibacter heidelbergensis]OOF35622.1 hypothetical protein BKK48_09180 [Rodentibacter heidelbergensis]
MKKIFLLIGCLSLSSCFYSNGCFYTPQMVNCVDKGKVFPSVSRYQKPYSLGKTNSEKRWKDVVACGGKYGDYDEASITTVAESDLFYRCMINKGYIHLTPAECGFQNPKWDKGKCNL